MSLLPKSQKFWNNTTGDAERSAQRLVEAANAAGGKDNISVVFVAGAEFQGAESDRWQDARTRHATTRPRSASSASPGWIKYLVLLLAGIALGFGAWQIIVHVTTQPSLAKHQLVMATPHVIEVSASNARGIIDALSTASAGDTISVPPGEFLGPLILKDDVAIVARTQHQSIVRCDPAAVAEQGIGMVARGVHKAEVKGLKIAADDTHPLKTAVLLVDSSVELADMDISGAVYSGVRIEGDSSPLLVENFIHGNGGAGVFIGDTASPKLVRNQIIQNGLMVNAVRPRHRSGSHCQTYARWKSH